MKNIKLGEDIAVLLFFDDARAICRYKRAGRKLTGYAAGVRADSVVFMFVFGLSICHFENELLYLHANYH